ncbi:MAG: sulfatase/phosphatase domain-containing protein, partial [Planctomycetota bacterium]|nr:sulfatase/phosphatase domain-containing protein [Planctomycetota bacterium]
MGDNGFLFGEHGLIDKRNAYEESMRIPMLAHCPELFPGGTVVKGVVANIDIAATFLAAAGLQAPQYMDGASFLDLASGKQPLSEWREYLLYEYYWEWNFPHTPTVFALRGNRYKLIVYHGIWDTDELYDLNADPLERQNLVHSKEHASVVRKMRQELYERLQKSGGTRVPFGFKRGAGANLRRESGSKTAPFPPGVLRKKDSRN